MAHHKSLACQISNRQAGLLICLVDSFLPGFMMLGSGLVAMSTVLVRNGLAVLMRVFYGGSSLPLLLGF